MATRRVLRFSLLACLAVAAQAFQGRFGSSQGVQLDLDGKGAEARAEFQKAIDSAATPAAKANATARHGDVLGLRR